MTHRHHVTRWISSTAAIAVGLLWLQRLGAGGLGGPPLSVKGAASWFEHRDPAVAAFASLRLIAVGFGWYLLLVTAIGGAATAFRLKRTAVVIDRLTLPLARGLLGGVALLGVMSSPPPVQPNPPDSMIELSPDPTSTTVAPDSSGSEENATLRLLPEAPDPAAPLPPAAAPDGWVVQHGDSFWSIAAEHLADLNGQPASERDVESYWHQVVELNRPRLANPNDADLLFAGQVIDLPVVTPG